MYSTSFDRAVEEVLGIEGGYSDHEADSGGATRYGVTEALARRYGYEGPMDELPQRRAVEIYHEHFWAWMRLDEVASRSEEVALELFDSAVNCGRERAWTWLQRALNVLNRGERDYEDIEDDGLPGPETLGALQAFLQARPDEGAVVLHEMLNALQGHHYVTLAERRSKDEAFVYGWFLQRVE